MKTTLLLVGIVVALAATVLAHEMLGGRMNGIMEGDTDRSMMQGGMGRGTMGSYHGQIVEIMEEGTYQDLANLREETGAQLMPWVTDQESFEAQQQHHDEMGKYRMGRGCH